MVTVTHSEREEIKNRFLLLELFSKRSSFGSRKQSDHQPDDALFMEWMRGAEACLCKYALALSTVVEVIAELSPEREMWGAAMLFSPIRRNTRADRVKILNVPERSTSARCFKRVVLAVAARWNTNSAFHRAWEIGCSYLHRLEKQYVHYFLAMLPTKGFWKQRLRSHRNKNKLFQPTLCLSHHKENNQS